MIKETAVTYPTILRLSFVFGLTLNNTSIPIPEFTNSPAHTAGKLKRFSRYNCVSNTLEAQLGINPVKVQRNMEALGYFKRKMRKVSMPMHSIAVFNNSPMTNNHIVIVKVCFRAEIRIP